RGMQPSPSVPAWPDSFHVDLRGDVLLVVLPDAQLPPLDLGDVATDDDIPASPHIARQFARRAGTDVGGGTIILMKVEDLWQVCLVERRLALFHVPKVGFAQAPHHRRGLSDDRLDRGAREAFGEPEESEARAALSLVLYLDCELSRLRFRSSLIRAPVIG